MSIAHRSATRTVFVVGAFAFVALALTGCTTSTKPVTDYRGEPKGVEAPASSAGGAPFSVWLKGGDEFTVTLYGSSGCPPVATGFKLTGHNRMTVTVPDPTAGKTKKACTLDYTPHTTVFTTPNTIDRKANVLVTAQDVRFTLPGTTK